MGSLSEYGRTAGAVHSLGYHLVWCPKYRRPVLVGGARCTRPRQDSVVCPVCGEHDADANEDAFYLSGRAALIHDRERRQVATAQFLTERKLTTTPEDFDAQDLFEFYLERCLWTATSGHGDWNPRHTIWRSN